MKANKPTKPGWYPYRAAPGAKWRCVDIVVWGERLLDADTGISVDEMYGEFGQRVWTSEWSEG